MLLKSLKLMRSSETFFCLSEERATGKRGGRLKTATPVSVLDEEKK